MKHIVLTSTPDEAVAANWNAMLADARLATSYASPAFFSDPYVRGQRFAVLAVDGDDTFAGVATGNFDDNSVTSGLFSRPQIAIRDDADRQAVAEALLTGMAQLTGGRPSLIELHSWDPLVTLADHGLDAAHSTAETSVVMLDLADGADAIFKGFSQTRRNELRKAERLGLVTVKELETAEELDKLYEIHCDWNRRKGHEPEDRDRIEAAASLGDSRRIFIATVEGRVVAASFYRFFPGGVAEYAANFSMSEYQRFRPNDLIGWHAIKWACEAGLKHFSMGGSHLFLRRFGGELLTTWRYSRDERPMSLGRLRSGFLELGAGAYRRLPENVRAGVRRVLAR